MDQRKLLEGPVRYPEGRVVGGHSKRIPPTLCSVFDPPILLPLTRKVSGPPVFRLYFHKSPGERNPSESPSSEGTEKTGHLRVHKELNVDEVRLETETEMYLKRRREVTEEKRQNIPVDSNLNPG